MTAPPKGKALPPTKIERALQDSQQHGDSKPASGAAQAGRDDWIRWRETLTAIQGAEIHPPVMRLLLLNLALHANARTGLAWPSVATLAAECSLSPAHTKRMLRTARAAGLLVVAQAARGGARSDTVRYRIDVETVRRGFNHEPGSTMKPVQIDTLRGLIHEPLPGSPMSYKEGNEDRENPPGGGAVSGSGFAGPTGADPTLWARWVKKSRHTSSELRDRVTRGNELNAQGVDLDALVKQALDNNWREWPRVDQNGLKGSQLGAAVDWEMPACH